MIGWFTNHIRIFKNTLGGRKKVGKFISVFFAILGGLSTLIDVLEFLFKIKCIQDICREYGVWILLAILISSYIFCRRKLDWQFNLSGTDIRIELTVKDIFEAKSDAYVIPTCTTFDTTLENEFISVHSVQGQFEQKYFNYNLSSLDHLLEEGLKGKNSSQLNRIKTKNKQYPLGTVSQIAYDDHRYYFAAVADVNESGVPVDAKKENIELALSGVWQEIKIVGHNESLAIPLLGTGRAGIPDAKVEDVIKITVKSFVEFTRTNSREATNKLVICVYPNDFDKIKNIDEVVEYVRYCCKYM